MPGRQRWAVPGCTKNFKMFRPINLVELSSEKSRFKRNIFFKLSDLNSHIDLHSVIDSATLLIYNLPAYNFHQIASRLVVDQVLLYRLLDLICN
jgi:hypothetical protein